MTELITTTLDIVNYWISQHVYWLIAAGAAVVVLACIVIDVWMLETELQTKTYNDHVGANQEAIREELARHRSEMAAEMRKLRESSEGNADSKKHS